MGNIQVNVDERQELPVCVVDVLCQCLMRMELYLEQLKPLNTMNNGSIRKFSFDYVLSLSLSAVRQWTVMCVMSVSFMNICVEISTDMSTWCIIISQDSTHFNSIQFIKSTKVISRHLIV